MFAPGWQNLPGGARDIGVGADCVAWVVGTNQVPFGYGLWEWTGSGFAGISGGGVRISVNLSRAPRIINSVNGIWRLLSTGWAQAPGSGTDIASSPQGDLFVIGTDKQPGGGGVYSFNGSGFDFFNGSGVRIALDPNGEPWVINNAHQIWRHTAGGWTQLPGAGYDIGVSANGAAWVIGTNAVPGGFGIWRWTGNGWASIDGGGVAISVGADGLPCIVNNGGAIYQRVF